MRLTILVDRGRHTTVIGNGNIGSEEVAAGRRHGSKSTRTRCVIAFKHHYIIRTSHNVVHRLCLHEHHTICGRRIGVRVGGRVRIRIWRRVRVGVWRRIGVRIAAVVVVIAERLLHLVTPHILLQSRIVDVGVAVSLTLIHRIVAIDLLLAYRVFLRPAQQHLQKPSLEHRIRIACKHRCSAIVIPRRHFVLIACSHVEVDTCDVTLIFVVRLKHSTAISLYRAGSQLTETVVRGVCRTVCLAIRIAAATVVHIAIGRQHMHYVRLHRRPFTKPTLRHGVLTVVYVALLLVVATIVGEAKVGGVGIYVPHLTVWAAVSLFVVCEQTIIAYVAHATVDDSVKRRFQRSTLLSISIPIVGAAVVWALREEL